MEKNVDTKDRYFYWKGGKGGRVVAFFIAGCLLRCNHDKIQLLGINYDCY
jgi:hypothetical protein